jgi:hypothetical protein
MALFSGKIMEAHYIDHEYSIVELLYTGDDGNVYCHALRADPNSPEWQALIADGWDQEKLAEGTAEYKRQQANSFSESINVHVQERLQEIINTSFKDKEKKLQEMEKELRANRKVIDEQIYDTLLTNNEDKEHLFKFKLWALEHQEVKDSSKSIKSEIRKSKTILEGLSILHRALNDK